MTIDYDAILEGVEWKEGDKPEEIVFNPKTGELKREPTENVPVTNGIFNDDWKVNVKVTEPEQVSKPTKMCQVSSCEKGMISPQSGTITAGEGIILTAPPVYTVNTVFEIDKTQMGCDKVAVLVEQAKDIVVDTDATATQGVSVALSARKLSSDISKARKTITAPHTAFRKKAISIEKEYTSQLLDLEHHLLGMVNEYQESRKERLEEHGIIDTSLDTIKTDVGSGKTKSYFEYKVVDKDKVPIEFLKLDKTAIDLAVKNGMRSITGIEIYETHRRKYRLKNKKETGNV